MFKLSPGWTETESEMFLEHGALTKPIPSLAMADIDFGVEPEMFTPPNLPVNNIETSSVQEPPYQLKT